MASTQQEVTHDQFAELVEVITAHARRVGLWTAGLQFVAGRKPRRWAAVLWRRHRAEQRRLVLYVRLRHRQPAAVVADIRRLIVRHARLSAGHLTPTERQTRAAALRRLTERDPLC